MSHAQQAYLPALLGKNRRSWPRYGKKLQKLTAVMIVRSFFKKVAQFCLSDWSKTFSNRTENFVRFKWKWSFFSSKSQPFVNRKKNFINNHFCRSFWTNAYRFSLTFNLFFVHELFFPTLTLSSNQKLKVNTENIKIHSKLPAPSYQNAFTFA